MNTFKKTICFCLLSLLSFFIIPFYCFADSNVSYYGGSGVSTGGGGGVGSNHFKGYLGYRFTLIDNEGKKYDGTRSVDVVYSPTAGDEAVVLLSGKQASALYENYKYRFGDNNSNDYIRIGSSVISIGNNATTFNVEQHNSFINEYITNYYNSEVFCPKSWDPKSTLPCDYENKIDFISLLLYYMNFFKNGETPKKFRLVHAEHPELNEYFFSVELLVQGTDNNRFGTATEMLQYMLDFGMWNSNPFLQDAQNFRDNIAVERLVFACGLYTTQEFEKKYSNFKRFNTYFSSYEECVKKSLVGENSNSLWTGNSCVSNNGAYGISGLSCVAQGWGNGAHIENLQNFNNTKNDYASGVAMISLDFDGTNNSNMMVSQMKMCVNDSVSLTIKPNRTLISNTDIFNVNSGADSSQSIYCYDNVSFDYSEMIQDISGEKLFNTKLDDVHPIIAKIRRTCYNNSGFSGYDVEKQLKLDYSKSIFVNAYGKKIEFKPDIDNISRLNNQYTIQYKTDTIVFNFNKYNTVQTGYIDFSNYTNLFGASGKFVNSIISKDSTQCDSNIFKRNDLTNCYKVDNNYYGLLFDNKSSDGQCTFNYTVKKDDSGIPSDTKFKFRVISLENPFPARDGTSRLPGLNWLNNRENNVFPYIINSRGIRYISQSNDVSPEEIYTKVSPMYTITLTPSKMLEIRNYNKSYAYDSMHLSISTDRTSSGAYKLECNYHDLENGNIGNGRECYSTFLRNFFDKTEISGDCYLTLTELNSYKQDESISSEIIQENITKKSDYEKKFDLNMNNRIDNEDVFIAKNSEKNIKYYTCANKSFLSGGPIEGGNK